MCEQPSSGYPAAELRERNRVIAHAIPRSFFVPLVVDSRRWLNTIIYVDK